MFYKPSVSLPPVAPLVSLIRGLSMDSFRTHLDAYMTLFRSSSSSVVLHRYARRELRAEPKELFHETFQRLWNPDSPFGLLQYFRTRRLWDEKQFAKLSNRDIELLNLLQERFWRIRNRQTCTRNCLRARSRRTPSGPNPASTGDRRRPR